MLEDNFFSSLQLAISLLHLGSCCTLLAEAVVLVVCKLDLVEAEEGEEKERERERESVQKEEKGK